MVCVEGGGAGERGAGMDGRGGGGRGRQPPWAPCYQANEVVARREKKRGKPIMPCIVQGGQR